MNAVILSAVLSVWFILNIAAETTSDFDEPPDGYYAFVESPLATPPKVRPPPYTHINVDCKNIITKKPSVSVHNICGDLNKGQIPRNPMGQNVQNEPYPFELIRNQTLKFLSKTLPVLKADDTLPKIAQIHDGPDLTLNESPDKLSRIERETGEDQEDNHPQQLNNRKPKKICDEGGVFCALYRAIQGDSSSPVVAAERREELGNVRYEGPPTPCPAKVEYATPVFAKNYQGTWRYVVQIPYEGYFTQTVEVTRCLQARCHYLDGGCLSSPRWVSLLVAEIFYPNSEDVTNKSTTTIQTPSVQDFQAYQKYLHKRAGSTTNAEPKPHCDGHDEVGCFQIRLYYDWFLIPGSCKCWRPDYFSKYVRRKSTTSDL